MRPTVRQQIRRHIAGRYVPRLKPALLALGLVLAGLAAWAGCSSAAPVDMPAKEPESVPGTGPETVTETATEAGAGEINPILATKALNVGPQRVAFLLAGKRAIIKAPEAAVTATYVGDSTAGGTGGSATTGRAIYRDWPYGIRGSYSVELTFDRAGPWRLDVAVEDGEVQGETIIDLEVVEDSPVPAIGERPPLSRTKTLDEVGNTAQLTTDYNADEELYRISVAEAIESPRPAVVVFATPAFCTSPTCGPQVETVKELKALYRGRADFVHIEIYDRPEEIQGDLSRATLVPAVAEWGFSSLPHWFNESWVFIMDDRGIVQRRFEGYATLEELEAALVETLGEG